MYWIHSTYCWYGDWTNKSKKLVKMYFINGIPFTWDELEDVAITERDVSKIKLIANMEKEYNVEQLYGYYSYLIEEQCNPLLFELDLENPEDLPDDIEIEEDLAN